MNYLALSSQSNGPLQTNQRHVELEASAGYGKVMIMAGGTGGHVYPALALAAELARRGQQIEWLGTPRGIENRLVPEAGYPLHHIQVSGVRGKSWTEKLAAPIRILRSVGQAWSHLRRLSPDLAVGFGGFASGPGGMACKLSGVPLVIHEQNAVAGTTNRLLAKMARRCLSAFPNVIAQGELVGNPVRPEILNLPSPWIRYQARSSEINVLVLGGSLGALAINQAMPEAVAGMSNPATISIRHQCGERWVQETNSGYASRGIEADVVSYISDMAEAYAWADIVVCRAGAMTVSEVASAGVAAIFIPLPGAIDDHQTANAKWLADEDAAWLVPQTTDCAQHIRTLLEEASLNRSLLIEKAEAARRLSHPDAVLKMADVCMEVRHER